MGPHDIEREEGDVLVCACGRPFDGPKRRDDHAQHFWLESAREALNEGEADGG